MAIPESVEHTKNIFFECSRTDNCPSVTCHQRKPHLKHKSCDAYSAACNITCNNIKVCTPDCPQCLNEKWAKWVLGKYEKWRYWGMDLEDIDELEALKKMAGGK